MTEFKAGDKVRVKKERSEGYTQPWRGWAESGRTGVILLVDEHSTRIGGNIKVDFVGKRKVKYPYDYWSWFFANELELVGEKEIML